MSSLAEPFLCTEDLNTPPVGKRQLVLVEGFKNKVSLKIQSPLVTRGTEQKKRFAEMNHRRTKRIFF